MSQSQRKKWVVLFTIFIGTVMAAMNASIVNLANPTLATTFGISIDQVQWISTIYLLVVTSTMLLFGRVGDRIGSHRVYIAGLVFFAAGSLLCGLASGFYWLLLGRVVASTGGAMMVATGMGLVATTFPVEQRGQALGIAGAAAGVGNMLGPSLGGFVLTHLHWSYIFFINLPLAVIVFALALRFLRSPLKLDKENLPSLDYMGALLLAATLSSLILALSGGFPGHRWFFLVTVAMVPLFILYERRHKAPLWDFELLRNRRFAVGNLLALLSYSAHMAVFFLLPFYMEEVLKLPTAVMGMLMMISPLFMAILAPLSGTVADKIGAMRLMPLAFLALCVSMAGFLTLTATSSWYHIAVSLLLMGIGMGMLNSPNNSEIMTAAGPKLAGYASAFVATVRNLGFCFGTATAAGLFHLLRNYFVVSMPEIAAYMGAFRCTMSLATVLMVAGLILCLWLRRSIAKQAMS